MTTTRRSTVRAAVLALVLLCGATAEMARADTSTTSGPTVKVDHTTVTPDERVLLTITGFDAPSATITVCGNEARRGSTDCNLYGSRATELNPAGAPTVLPFVISEPSGTCPCVIRVASQSNDQVAIAPITLTGHPVGPPIDPPNLDNALGVTIDARATSTGLIELVRPSMGGPTEYEITVTVKNRLTVPVTKVQVAGSVGRNSDDTLATLSLGVPGTIGPGQTWKQTVRSTVPAPSFGSLQWRLAASGVGSTVTVTDTTTHRPWLLIVVLMLLIVDISLLAIRFAVRRHAARAAADPDGLGDRGSIGDVIDATSSEDGVDEPASEVQELATSAH